jgi:hypothetical protein
MQDDKMLKATIRRIAKMRRREAVKNDFSATGGPVTIVFITTLMDLG